MEQQHAETPYQPWSEENLQVVIDLWQLSSDAEKLLRNLHQRTQDVEHEWNDPHVLVRYMYAPHGYSQAERLFRRMIQWRMDNDVDNILQTYQPNQLLLDYASPLAFLKDYDRDGDPIYIERGGMIDGQGLLKRFSQKELMRHAIWLREVQSSGEWVTNYETEKGRCIKDITVVYDLQGLNMRHYQPNVLAWFQSHMKMTEDYYPGPIKRIIIIRAPAIFRLIWSIVKHFFPKCARDKMVFAGPNNHMEVLSRYIDPINLPPCINPMGQGGPAHGMPDNCFEAGRIPEYVGNGGRYYTPKNVWVSPHLKSTTTAPSPPLVKKESSGESSTQTMSTAACDLSDDELETSMRSTETTGWEEVISFEENDRSHVLWQDTTGVEISPSFVNKNRSEESGPSSAPALEVADIDDDLDFEHSPEVEKPASEVADTTDDLDCEPKPKPEVEEPTMEVTDTNDDSDFDPSPKVLEAPATPPLGSHALSKKKKRRSFFGKKNKKSFMLMLSKRKINFIGKASEGQTKNTFVQTNRQ